MAYHPKEKLTGRAKRKVRVRKKIYGTSEKPRMNVFRSSKHIYVQVIDDDSGRTMASASSVSKSSRSDMKGNKKDQAKLVGIAVAAACKEQNITTVVFDRNGYRYHGRVQAVAEGARESGLQF